MVIPADIMLDSNYDLLIQNGDWDVDDCNEVDADLIINTSRGNWKQWPLVGFGLSNYLESEVDKTVVDEINSGIKVQLQADGFTVNGVNILLTNNGLTGITLDADRSI